MPFHQVCDIIVLNYYNTIIFLNFYFIYMFIMTTKLLLSFDLHGKSEQSYLNIRTWLQNTFLITNVSEILATEYAIKTTRTPEQLYNAIVSNNLIDSSDRCFIDVITNSNYYYLDTDKANFISS